MQGLGAGLELSGRGQSKKNLKDRGYWRMGTPRARMSELDLQRSPSGRNSVWGRNSEKRAELALNLDAMKSEAPQACSLFSPTGSYVDYFSSSLYQ